MSAPDILGLLQQVIANQKVADDKLTTHMEEESQEIANKIAESIARLSREAFIDSNLEAHKKDHESRFAGIEEQLRLGEIRMGNIEASIEKNTEVTNEIYDIVAAGKGFFKVVGKIGAVVKWVVGIAAGLAGMWTIFHEHMGGK